MMIITGVGVINERYGKRFWSSLGIILGSKEWIKLLVRGKTNHTDIITGGKNHLFRILIVIYGLGN